MLRAAVPDYLSPKAEFSNASIGLRYGMFLQGWRQGSWKFLADKSKIVKKACTFSVNDRDCARALLERQKSIALSVEPSTLLFVCAKSTAPFATGLGNEHVLENGFSFLSPYGLPYLPGSGVKGVVREAARELTSGNWGDSTGWSAEWDAVLFGPESNADTDERRQGALRFWDVFPQVKPSGGLAVEIMTPHQTEYLQGKESPHDCGGPNPIPFLVVPEGSEFVFHVTCDLRRLECSRTNLIHTEKWNELLDTAFCHAFEWVGFGAKTSVGYGAMCFDKQAHDKYTKWREERPEPTEPDGTGGSAPELRNDAAWLRAQQKSWKVENDFLDTMERFIERFDADQVSVEALEDIRLEIDKRWPGILENPDATRGKAKKPKYSPRPRAIAKKYLDLNAKNSSEA